MRVVRLTTPTSPTPLTVAELKAYLRLNDDGEDDLLALFLDSAKQVVEDQTGYTVLATSFRLDLDSYPADRKATLPRSPVNSVTSVTVEDDDGNATTVTGWRLAGRMVYLPALFGSCRLLSITFSAGTDTPSKLVKLAVYSLASHYYANREAFTDTTLIELPQGFDVVCDMLRAAIYVGGQA
jgi:hypothetical protein